MNKISGKNGRLKKATKHKSVCDLKVLMQILK